MMFGPGHTVAHPAAHEPEPVLSCNPDHPVTLALYPPSTLALCPPVTLQVGPAGPIHQLAHPDDPSRCTLHSNLPIQPGLLWAGARPAEGAVQQQRAAEPKRRKRCAPCGLCLALCALQSALLSRAGPACLAVLRHRAAAASRKTRNLSGPLSKSHFTKLPNCLFPLAREGDSTIPVLLFVPTHRCDIQRNRHPWPAVVEHDQRRQGHRTD